VPRERNAALKYAIGKGSNDSRQLASEPFPLHSEEKKTPDIFQGDTSGKRGDGNRKGRYESSPADVAAPKQVGKNNNNDGIKYIMGGRKKKD